MCQESPILLLKICKHSRLITFISKKNCCFNLNSPERFSATQSTHSKPFQSSGFQVTEKNSREKETGKRVGTMYHGRGGTLFF